MKAIGKFVLYGLIVAIVLLVGYGVHRFLLPHWVAFLFYAYFACGLAATAYGTAQFIAQQKEKSATDELRTVLGEALRPDGLMERVKPFRNYLSLVCTSLQEIATWPAAGLMGAILRRRAGAPLRFREMSFRASTGLYVIYSSIYALLLALLVLGLSYLGIRLGGYGAATLLIVLVSVGLRHISYLVSVVPLQAYLRRATRLPYLAFLVIIGADLVTLVLTAAATSQGIANGLARLNWTTLYATAKTIIFAEGPWKLIHGRELTAHQLLVGIAGLLFSSALVKILLQFREFKRTDEDYILMAQTANELGNFSGALRSLEQVKTLNALGWATKAVAYTGVNQLDLAEKEAQRWMEASSITPTPAKLFLNMWSVCVFNRIAEDVGLSVFRKGIASGVPDQVLQSAASKVQSNPSLLAKLDALLNGQEQTYPLTVGSIFTYEKKVDAAIGLLSAGAYTDPTAEIGRRVMLLLAQIYKLTTDAEMTAHFRQWSAEELPAIHKLAAKVTDSFDSVLTLGNILILIGFARELQVEKVQELIFLYNSVRPKAAPEAIDLKVLDTAMQNLTKNV